MPLIKHGWKHGKCVPCFSNVNMVVYKGLKKMYYTLGAVPGPVPGAVPGPQPGAVPGGQPMGTGGGS